MKQVTDFLPFLLPLAIVEFSLLAYVIHHIFTHKNYKHGNRMMWMIIVIVGMNFIGPILYLLIGKEEA